MISHGPNFTLYEIHIKSKGHSDTVMYEKTKGIVKIFFALAQRAYLNYFGTLAPLHGFSFVF